MFRHYLPWLNKIFFYVLHLSHFSPWPLPLQIGFLHHFILIVHSMQGLLLLSYTSGKKGEQQRNFLPISFFLARSLSLSHSLSLFVTVCVYECKSTCVGFVNFKRLAFALLLLFSYTYEIVCVCMHGDCVCVCLFNFMKHARMLKKFFDWVDYKIPLLITE